MVGVFQAALLHGDGGCAQVGQRRRRSAAGRSLIPCSNVLEEPNANDTHAPLEILGPGSNNWWQSNGSQSDERLGLEITKECESVGSDVCCSVGVTQARGNGRSDQRKTRDDSDNPCDSLLVNGLAVGQLGLDTGSGVVGIGSDEVDLYLGIEIWDGVCDARHLLQCVVWDGHVGERQVDLTFAHGTQTVQLQLARVDLLLSDLESVCEDVQQNGDIAGDGADTDHLKGEGVVVGCQHDVEARGTEVVVVLAGGQGV